MNTAAAVGIIIYCSFTWELALGVFLGLNSVARRTKIPYLKPDTFQFWKAMIAPLAIPFYIIKILVLETNR